jgi:hypothetical protein
VTDDWPRWLAALGAGAWSTDVDVAEHLGCGCGICAAELVCPAIERMGDVTWHCVRTDIPHTWHVDSQQRSWQ